MTPIVAFNTIVGVVFGLCFLYQVVFFFVGLLRGEVKIPRQKKTAFVRLLYRGP